MDSAQSHKESNLLSMTNKSIPSYIDMDMCHVEGVDEWLNNLLWTEAKATIFFGEWKKFRTTSCFKITFDNMKKKNGYHI